MYTYESFAELANKLQSKVTQMTQEMTDKADELENYKEEITTAQGTFEEIENEIQELIDSINEMNDFESRIEEAVSEADRLMT